MRTKMSPETVAFVTDALLALCEKTPGEPCFSEEKLRLKLAISEQRDPIYAMLMAGRPEDPLLRQECNEVLAKARLTHRQSVVLSRRLYGCTFEEIGKSTGHTKQAAQNIFVQALKKIAQSFRVYPFRGLSDVYRGEVRRGCPKGRGGKILRSAG